MRFAGTARLAWCVALGCTPLLAACGQGGAQSQDAGVRGDGSSENCTDGVDNDGDGLVDCADPDCQAGYTCVAAPAGWTVGAFLPTTAGLGLPSCPAGYTPSPLSVQQPASTVTCSCNCGTSCGEVSCGSPGRGPSGPLYVTIGGADAACAEGEAGTLPSAGCVAYPLSAGQSIGFAQPPFWSSGSLSVDTSTASHPDALLCTASATGGGCGAGRACAPKASGLFDLCPYQPAQVHGTPLSAAVACPPDWVRAAPSDGGAPVAFGVATGWDDSNACTPCDCEPDPDAGCADAALTLYAGPNCQSSVASVGPGACARIAVDVQSAQYSATPVGAGCTNVSPREPTGIETSLPDAGYVVCCVR